MKKQKIIYNKNKYSAKQKHNRYKLTFPELDHNDLYLAQCYAFYLGAKVVYNLKEKTAKVIFPSGNYGFIQKDIDGTIFIYWKKEEKIEEIKSKYIFKWLKKRFKNKRDLLEEKLAVFLSLAKTINC